MADPIAAKPKSDPAIEPKPPYVYQGYAPFLAAARDGAHPRAHAIASGMTALHNFSRIVANAAAEKDPAVAAEMMEAAGHIHDGIALALMTADAIAKEVNANLVKPSGPVVPPTVVGQVSKAPPAPPVAKDAIPFVTGATATATGTAAPAVGTVAKPATLTPAGTAAATQAATQTTSKPS